VSYTYDNGRRRNGLSVQAPNASPWSQSYGYDAANRLSTLSSPAGSFTHAYHAGLSGSSPASLVKSLSLPNGSAITNNYDSHARMLGTWLRKNDGTLLNKHEYALNDLDQRTKQTRTGGDYVDYAYDPLGQLTNAVGKELGGVTNRWHEQFAYKYDAAGNLTNRVQHRLTNSFAVNSLNQLTGGARAGRISVGGITTGPATNVTVNTSNSVLYLDYTFASTNHALVDGTNTFTAIARDSYGRIDTNISTTYLPASPTFVYDLNGNLTYDGQKALEYDDENQLVRLIATNAWKSEFAYDGKRRRRVRREFTWQNSAWVQTNEVRYIYDGKLAVQERDNFNLPVITFTRGRDFSGGFERGGGIGGLLARRDHRSSVAHDAYFHSDGNGNVTALVSTNQAAAAKYSYDPFGVVLSMSGPLAEENLYRFSSKEFHPPSGLISYPYRYYVPQIHRWLNQDPIAETGGINLYGFVGGDGVNRSDPFGLSGGVTAPVEPPLRLPGPIRYPVGPPPILVALGVGVCLAILIEEGSKIIYPDPSCDPLPLPGKKKEAFCGDPETDTCDKTRDWVDPETGRRFCTYKCRKSGRTFNREGLDCDQQTRTVIIKELPPPPP
jgi:RHS repeat-associated protein